MGRYHLKSQMQHCESVWGSQWGRGNGGGGVQKGQLSSITIAKINSLVLFLGGWSNFQQWNLFLKGNRNCCRIGTTLPCTWLCPKYDKRKKNSVFEESQWQPHNIREAALLPRPSASIGHEAWSSCGPPRTTKESVFGSELSISRASWTENLDVSRWLQKYQMKLSLLPCYIRSNF